MCIYIYIFNLYIYICIYIYVCIYIYICKEIDRYEDIYIYIHIDMNMYR